MSDASIMPGADFARTAADYAAHRAGPPPQLFDRLATFGVGLPGQRICDLGSGTGALARPLAARGAAVVSTDPARPLLVGGRELAASAGLSLDRVQSTAESIPFAPGSFDVVAAAQCWHWFDRPAAAAEGFRVLKPAGRLVITHFDWLPVAGNVVEATERLILAHNPRWGGAGGVGFYPRWPGDVSAVGFGEIETFSFDVDVAYSHESWRGRIRASAGVGGAMTPGEVERFDGEHAELLKKRFPAEPLQVPHRVWTLVARKPG